MEVILSFDPGRVPAGVAVCFTEVRHLAFDFEVSFYGWRRLLAGRALPVTLELPLAFLAFVNTDSVFVAVNSDQIFCAAFLVLDLVPHDL